MELSSFFSLMFSFMALLITMSGCVFQFVTDSVECIQRIDNIVEVVLVEGHGRDPGTDMRRQLAPPES